LAANPEFVSAQLEGTGLIPALRVGKRPVVTVGLFEYRETSIGPYNEVGVAIFVYPGRYGHSRSLTGWAQLLKRPAHVDVRNGMRVHSPLGQPRAGRGTADRGLPRPTGSSRGLTAE